MAIDVKRVNNIYAPTTEQGGKLILHFEDAKADDMLGIEFNEDVHVAVWPKIIAQH